MKIIRLIKIYLCNQNYFDISSINLEWSFLLLDDARNFLIKIFYKISQSECIIMIDKRNIWIGRERHTTTDSVLKNVFLIFQALISFGGRHTETPQSISSASSQSLCRVTKWQRVGRPGPAILPFPFRNYANCRLSFLSSVAYCGRKCLVIDYARRTFGTRLPQRPIDGELAKRIVTLANGIRMS